MTHGPGPVEQVLAELERWHEPDADPELEAVRLAILLEDTLGITLDDADLDTLRLGGRASVAALVARRQERP